MNWSDERYVKLYTRKTATWLLWPWQARAVFPLMLKECDGAGLVDVGTRDRAGTLAVMIGIPVEVVTPAVDAMVETGTVELTDRGFLVTNYIEAQEATKTDSRRKQDQRERQRAQVRATTQAGVTRGHAESRAVPLQPSPAQPSPAQPPAQPSPTTSPVAAAPAKKPKKVAAQAELPEMPPKPPRQQSRGEWLFSRFLEMRGDHLDDLGVDPAPDAQYSPAFINQTMKVWLELFADARFPPAAAELGYLNGAEFRTSCLFDEYFQLTWPAKCVARVDGEDTNEPQPWPFSALASEKVWRPLIEKLDTMPAPTGGVH